MESIRARRQRNGGRESLTLGGISECSARPDLRRLGHARRFKMTRAQNVEHCFPCSDQIVRYDSPVTSPPYRFRTHNRAPFGVSQFAQPAEAGMKVCAQGVICVVAKAVVFPERI